MIAIYLFRVIRLITRLSDVRQRCPQPHAKIGPHIFISSLHTADDTIKLSDWITRAWTYQEALLSRRRIIFTDEQVYYECESMYCYEVFDFPWQLVHNAEIPEFKH